MVAEANSDMPARYRQAMDRIDACNKQDPNGREYDYSLALTRWVLSLQPEASEALRLAARAQHIARWQIPRDTYPQGRNGYLRWRKDLMKFHAATAADILSACGYDQTMIERVKSIMLKKRIKEDQETQTLEDALCLVFMERQLEDFKEQVDEDKLANVIRKTWNKMSQQGHEAAMSLPLPDSTRRFIERTLS
ncbi:MAG: DUF4202 domain-containing protein [Pseudomonadales bacterium]